MSQLFGPPKASRDKTKDPLKESRNALRVVRAGGQIAQDLGQANPERAIQHAILAGMKLATPVFYDELASPRMLLDELQKMGPEVLTWEPEALMATIDQKFGGWTPEQAAGAIEVFNETGLMKTDVPPLVRQKIYSIRIAATSDAPYSEWNLFEKVGAAFNDRLAQFSVIEPLSAEECVRTIVDLIKIRPDDFTDEVKIYIAACCHEAGLYTVSPVPVLQMCEKYLKQMNYESTGEQTDAALVRHIDERFRQLKKESGLSAVESDDMVEVQARKCLALDALAS